MDVRLTLPTHTAVRYVVPLREGGSLPAVLETEHGALFVAKFRGAGQGAKALLAELIVGLLARHLGLPVPDLAVLHLDASFGRTERDPEIQDILKGSRGLNVGLRYLDGAFNYDPLAAPAFVSPEFAADLVWLDAFVTNIDRTPRNPNLLLWQRQVWLIDHGAALYFHHNWEAVDAERAKAPFPPIQNHVLLPLAGNLEEADVRMTSRLDADVIRHLLALLPDELLMDTPEGRTPAFPNAEANRAAYLGYLTTRLQAPRAFLQEALHAQEALRGKAPQPLPYRR